MKLTKARLQEIIKEEIKKVNQSKNGVKVVKTLHFDNKTGEKIGSTVEADCMCFGNPKRTHSNPLCPLIENTEE